MTDFNIGDRVMWSSQAGGFHTTKTGTIAEVVAAGDRPDRDRFTRLYASSGIGLPRNHTSYVVLVGNTPYWPRANKLQQADD